MKEGSIRLGFQNQEKITDAQCTFKSRLETFLEFNLYKLIDDLFDWIFISLIVILGGALAGVCVSLSNLKRRNKKKEKIKGKKIPSTKKTVKKLNAYDKDFQHSKKTSNACEKDLQPMKQSSNMTRMQHISKTLELFSDSDVAELSDAELNNEDNPHEDNPHEDSFEHSFSSDFNKCSGSQKYHRSRDSSITMVSPFEYKSTVQQNT